MTDQAEALRDAITARLWECLPQLLNELPKEEVRGRVSEKLIQDLAGLLTDAITRSPREGPEAAKPDLFPHR